MKDPQSQFETLPDFIQQPGPAGECCTMVPTRLLELDVVLPANIPLDEAISQVIETRGLSGAYIRITDAKISRLCYVIPGISSNDKHVAWYSETYTPLMPGRIIDASIVCGFLSRKPSLHCHGLFDDADRQTAMGHLVLEACYLSNPIRVTGFGFEDAYFNRETDQETNFDLLIPQSVDHQSGEYNVSDSDKGMLVRIAPNVEIASALVDCCRNADWQSASIYGVGSLIGAHFDDGRILNSYATEYMITSGVVDMNGPTASVDLHMALVGLGGCVMQGRLKTGSNPVLITSELVLKNNRS